MLTEYFFFVFTGAALMACFAMYTRQPLLVAYIVLGAILGPYGLGLVEDIELLTQAAEIGIIFLLFLLGPGSGRFLPGGRGRSVLHAGQQHKDGYDSRREAETENGEEAP